LPVVVNTKIDTFKTTTFTSYVHMQELLFLPRVVTSISLWPHKMSYNGTYLMYLILGHCLVIWKYISFHIVAMSRTQTESIINQL